MLFEEGRVNMGQEYENNMFFVSVFYLYSILLILKKINKLCKVGKVVTKSLY